MYHLTKMAQTILFGLLLSIFAFAVGKSFQREHGFGIIGGEVAKISELPYQVYIEFKGDVWCGGAIISPQHVLTINWCIRLPTDYAVVAATDDGSIGGDKYTIAEVTEHPDGRNSIAVVKLTKEINFSEKAKPIALAGPKYNIKEGTELIASGWGHTEGGSKSVKLRKVVIPKVSDGECKQAYHYFNLSKQFCAGGKGKKTCTDDEGGPIIAKTSKGNVLVGLTGIEACDDQNTPSRFIKISTLNKWIKEIVKNDLQSN